MSPSLPLESTSRGANLGQVETVQCHLQGKLEFPKSNVTETIRRRAGIEIGGSSSLDHTSFAVGLDSFTLFHKDDHTVLDCEFGGGGVAACRHIRIIEALQFALGQIVQPFAWVVNSAGVVTTRIWPPWSPSAAASVLPPFQWNADPVSRVPFEIARAFYTAALTYSGEKWHPISYRIHQIVDAGNASIDMRELTHAIATEGAISICYDEAGTPAEGFKADVTLARKTLKALEISPEAARRIDGSLNGLLFPRNSDRLMAFVRDKNLPDDLYTTWNRMRNSVAHGRQSDEDLESRWANLSRVLFLFYSIVFHHIHYSGPRAYQIKL